jgi:formate--tetrahydrofolate ligase
VPEVRLSAGVEFVVAISGEVMAMPGLPRLAAVDMIGTDGKIVALF